MAMESTDKSPNRFLVFIKGHVLPIVGGTLLILAIIPSVYFYAQYQQAKDRLANPTQFAAEEAKKLVREVAKLMALPADETPTVATVNDKEKLKNQPFFARSENGDKVLIYTNAKKAILFRPSINKIIDVAPINLGPQATQSGEVAGATPAPAKKTFVLLNGTTIVGLTKRYETELKSKVPGAEIVDKDNAKMSTYQTSLLVDVKGTKGTEASSLASALGLTVEPLPVGEATPAADYLIVLGADRK